MKGTGRSGMVAEISRFKVGMASAWAFRGARLYTEVSYHQITPIDIYKN